MYARRIRGRNQRWGSVFQQSKYFTKLNYHDQPCRYLSCINGVGCFTSQGTFIRRYLLDSTSSRSIEQAKSYVTLHSRSLCFKNSQIRTFSSQGDGRGTSEDEHASMVDGPDFDGGKHSQKTLREDTRSCDAHARLAELDQKEWLSNEKFLIESKKKESPFLTRREKFKNEFLRRVVPWEKIHVSLKTFPYYLNANAKSILVECVESHFKHKKLTNSYGARLASSSGRILLQSTPGTELYRERIVKALAQDLQIPLLVLDSSVLAPYDLADDSECESDDNTESGEECTSESEVDDENEAATEEEWTSSAEARSDADNDVVDMEATAEAAIKKLVPFNLEEFAKRVSGEPDGSSKSSNSKAADSSDNSRRPLRKGDRVKYTGPSVRIEADDRIILGKISTTEGLKNAYTNIRGRPLSSGQRGEVYEVNGDRVAVILDLTGEIEPDKDKDEQLVDQSVKAPIYWIDVKDIERDTDAEAEDCYIAMEALSEVLHSIHPLIVYFPDISLWLSRAVPKSNRREFFLKVQEMFDKVPGPVVFICGQNKVESGSKEKENITMIFPNFGRLAKLPLSLKRLTEGLKTTKRSDDNYINKIFSNVLTVNPPKEEELLKTFNKQIEEDRRIVIARSNMNELQKVLEENEMSCMDLLHVNTDGVILTRQRAEKVVGWAKNHYLSGCLLPSIKGDRLSLPRESLEVAIMRLREQETVVRKPSQNLKNLAKDEYESNFVSAVVPPGEIGVRFGDIGALEDVKKALNELVILPMRRPELFSHGHLLRPCKGILLLGPWNWKTLVAKALATEAGANFISITGSTLTSKWFGDAEKLTKALFSFASRLAPVIIFVDEVDSLLGARGGAFEHEATRRMRNEFMAAWDGLRSKDSQRILILGATNRPFDLDDAVIRQLAKEVMIYVDLPDAENRMKILRIILGHENLEPDFDFRKLAIATDGYSGSDLKNLCIAAAYRPVQELLEEEMKGGQRALAPGLRPLHLDDFIQSKAKVGPSVAFDASSMNELRKWNEQYGEGGSRKRSPFGF
ncbi:hypothetical protein K2173_012416 [Erythroxylum novogranatense]|uniref:AAA+ ATPase domain-containing protein n=1 Tax=Erythroxylum novogranatense TaxID=1862640 RepID=A0AAV8S706_9ROSI|nr:hypothetical protein K2173_012416 [Erythroxylum novogranatense]